MSPEIKKILTIAVVSYLTLVIAKRVPVLSEYIA